MVVFVSEMTVIETFLVSVACKEYALHLLVLTLTKMAGSDFNMEKFKNFNFTCHFSIKTKIYIFIPLRVLSILAKYFLCT